MTSEEQSADTNKGSSKGLPFDRKGGIRILGFGKQEAIKAFFAGNSLVAIFILGLICIFLLREAAGFFPKHHEGLTLYRRSGQEFVSYLEKQYIAQKETFALADQAYQLERNRVASKELKFINGFKNTLALVEDDTEDSCDVFLDARDEYIDLKEEFEELRSQGDAKKLAELKPEFEEANSVYTSAEAAWKKSVQEVLSGADREKIASGLTDQQWETVQRKLSNFDPEKVEFPFLKELEVAIDAKVTPLKEVREILTANEKPIKSQWLKLRSVASKAKTLGVNFTTAPERVDALKKGMALAKTEEAKAKLQKQMDEVNTVEPDYVALIKPLYDAKPKHQEISKNLVSDLKAIKEKLPKPEDIADADARDRIESLRAKLPGVIERIEGLAIKAKTWKHDTSYSWGRSIGAFFFGADWITNSSWHDFYGVLPLFTGSLVISTIAIIFAIPFALGAAIYVNQIASPMEQSIIKPAIEFIQAIPSVVLGFFGIVVLGETMRQLSQWGGLSWIPGFPMQERLNMLNAGLLLGLMAIPTIFTLAEDSINNVPRSFRDASYALGATKLQTVIKVIVPTAISGIIAAVLLGFGRVIGETMVVLLVAGNKIAIPDFSQGIGVLTQPAHTMTGIIAQETGEVDKGSLHWRALFMVGLLLFVISLGINFISQRIISKFRIKA